MENFVDRNGGMATVFIEVNVQFVAPSVLEKLLEVTGETVLISRPEIKDHPAGPPGPAQGKSIGMTRPKFTVS